MFDERKLVAQAEYDEGTGSHWITVPGEDRTCIRVGGEEQKQNTDTANELVNRWNTWTGLVNAMAEALEFLAEPDPTPIHPGSTAHDSLTKAFDEAIAMFRPPYWETGRRFVGQQHTVECVNACKGIDPKAVPKMLRSLQTIESAGFEPGHPNYMSRADMAGVARAAIAKARRTGQDEGGVPDVNSKGGEDNG